MLSPQDFELLLDLNNQLAAARDKDAVLDAVVKKLKPIFKFEVAVVVQLEKDRKYTTFPQTFASRNFTKRIVQTV